MVAQVHEDLTLLLFSFQAFLYPLKTLSGFLMFRGGYLKENSLTWVIQITLCVNTNNTLF